jgi:hypothetical protein
MLSDLTLEMCVPSFRWRAAHRMHRKIPSYSESQSEFRMSRGSIRVAVEAMWYTEVRHSHSNLPILRCSVSVVQLKARMLLTWVLCTTVSACTIPRHRLDQLLQCSLIARLLALVQGGCHLVRSNARVAQGMVLGERRQNVHEGKRAGFEEAGERLGYKADY